MKILMISTDINILKDGSDVRQRMFEYGDLFESLDIVVLGVKNNLNFKVSKKTLGNVNLYFTNSKNKIFMFFDAYKIAKKLKKPDVVTSQDPFENGFVAYMIAGYFKARLQLQIHTDFLSPFFKKESLKNKLRIFLADFLMPKADLIRLVSKRIEKSLKKRYDKKTGVALVPIFIDTNKLKNAKININLHKKYPQFDFIILMASRITKEKNIALAISALKMLLDKYKKIGLIIVGSGPEKDRLKNLALGYKIKDNVVFESWRDDLVSYYKSSDLFLLTSDYEGYARTIVEALSCSLPVVSLDVGCAREFDVVLSKRDKKDIAKKIESMIEKNKKVKFKYSYKNKDDFLDKFKKSFEL